jgi:hypothetical protein
LSDYLEDIFDAEICRMITKANFGRLLKLKLSNIGNIKIGIALEMRAADGLLKETGTSFSFTLV